MDPVLLVGLASLNAGVVLVGLARNYVMLPIISSSLLILVILLGT
jgi:hypothetical protein